MKTNLKIAILPALMLGLASAAYAGPLTYQIGSFGAGGLDGLSARESRSQCQLRAELCGKQHLGDLADCSDQPVPNGQPVDRLYIWIFYDGLQHPGKQRLGSPYLGFRLGFLRGHRLWLHCAGKRLLRIHLNSQRDECRAILRHNQCAG